RASALVTLTERVAHEVGIALGAYCPCVGHVVYVNDVWCTWLVYYTHGVYVVFGYPRFFVSQAHVFVVLGVCPAGLRVRGYETERLFLCCVVRSRLDPFEVCPGVGTVVTAVVACGVPSGGTVLVMVGLTVGSACGDVVSDLYHQQLSRVSSVL
ncbi:hypothetical protein Taro_004676, partial [Colocasia esculenta]|nr:hypothetical protein [Colocasia esculenta]